MKNLSTIPRMKRMFVVALLLAMGFSFSESASQCVTPPSGLVSWWPGEGNASDIQDGNDGTLQNGTTFASGMVGQAFSFDGVDDAAFIADNASLRVSSFTLDAWINTADATLIQPIIAKVQTSENWISYMLRIQDGGKLALIVENRAENRYAHWRTLSTLSSNRWYHVAGTWQNLNGDNTDAKIYIDGVEQAIEMSLNNGYSSTFLPGYTSEPLYIGRDGQPSGRFVGLIDEIDIYDRVLSASEIQSIFNAGSAGKCTNTPPPVCVNPPSGLVSWWPGDDNANDIKDGNNGTLVNGATFAAGLVDQAFSFDGVDDFVRIEDNSNLRLGTGEITIDAWIKASPSNTFRAIAAKLGLSFPFPGYALRIADDNKVEFLAVDCATGSCGFSLPGGGGSKQPVRSISVVADNTFHHVTGVRRPDGTLEIYVDGVLENTRVEPLRNTDSADPFTIGEIDAVGPEQPFNGLIDEVDIYNRALSASEIQSIYNAGSAGKCKECTPPEVSITGSDPVCPNSTHTYTANTDAANPTFEWSVTGGTIYGDNNGNSVSVIAGDAGTMTVRVEVTDGATNCSNSATQEITVEDTEAPVIGTITAPMDPNQVNTLINASAGFTDVCDANDHTAEWNWGDGNTTPGMVDQNANTVSGSHSYTAAGVYTLTLTVTDGASNFDTEVFQFVVIYDPNAGYVTGGGWIESPPEAYPANPSLTGKAHFGFVSKYQKGKSTPDGNTQFDFKMADLKFKSTSYDWLVISGPHAKYKGSGTINGAGDYGFLLFARDGQVNGDGVDQFRIKIWQKDADETVIYDNQMGAPEDGDAADAIEGGNINIHSDGASKATQEELASEAIPESYALEQNYPNPFNPSTSIKFSVKEAGVVQLSIYNLHGQEVRTLVNGQINAGFHSVNWDGKDARGQLVPSGVYLYKLRVNGFSQTRKMIFMK